MSTLSHIDPESNQPTMVDVSHKAVTQRQAHARGYISLPQTVSERLDNGDIATKKGPVFHTAIIAGTQAAKRTADWIPFCHPLLLESIKIEITPEPEKARIRIDARIKMTGKTGVEMEALTAVSAAALTIYDMCKALSQEMCIERIELIEKLGGKSAISQ